jgi:hypothetical protein
MPQALRDAITRAPRSQLFDQPTGGTIRADAIDAWAAGRLPIALLAVVATAYELSPIEQAVADGVSYTGDQPGDELTIAGKQHDSATTEAPGGDHQALAPDIPAETSPDDTAAQETV